MNTLQETVSYLLETLNYNDSSLDIELKRSAIKHIIENQLVKKVLVKNQIKETDLIDLDIDVIPVYYKPKKVKNVIDSLDPFVDHGDVRYYLRGALVEGDVCVATNGHYMAVIEQSTNLPNGIHPTKSFREVDKHLLKDGLIEGRFPEWRRVIPNRNDLSHITVDVQVLMNKINGMVKATSFYRSILNAMNFYIDDMVFSFNFEYVFECLKLILDNGYKTVVIGYKNQNTSIVFNSPDMKIQCVLMPLQKHRTGVFKTIDLKSYEVRRATY